MKHYVRTDGWLPLCRRRKNAINQGVPEQNGRRLRYFTFCAVGALDVLMLDVARVLRPSRESGFDTVCFFDQSPEFVIETKKRIPGAVGFGGNFVDTVLANASGQLHIADESEDALSADRDDPDTEATRRRQRLREERARFIEAFPFDVINLDLEEFLFKPTELLPGRLITAMRQVFVWQRRPLSVGRKSKPIDGFSLMFTTQIGPPNLSDDYLDMLGLQLTDNLSRDSSLEGVFQSRTGRDGVAALRVADRSLFFKLGMPKILMNALMEEDWYADPELGVVLYEFDRDWSGGTYTMLHLLMDVRRHVPPKELRAPGAESQTAKTAYSSVVHRVFSEHSRRVELAALDQRSLRTNLDRIVSRRRKYMEGS